MTFEEYSKIISSGFDLPQGIKIPEHDCSSCGQRSWGVGLCKISCLSCGYVTNIWFVPLEKGRQMVQEKIKRNKK